MTAASGEGKVWPGLSADTRVSPYQCALRAFRAYSAVASQFECSGSRVRRVCERRCTLRAIALTALAFLVPGPFDQITGGYLFGRRVVEGLRALGRTVTVAELAGRYPDADDAARAAVTATLGSLPTGSAAVIDGLALPGCVDCLKSEAQRLRLVGFIHHPLSLETGLSPAEVRHYAALEARLWPLLRGILCPSAHTARAVIASGVAAHRVVVTMPGTAKPESRGGRAGQGPLRLLAVGTRTPRKR